MSMATLFFAGFYVLGTALLLVGLWQAYRSVRAADWPTTPGTLESVELSEQLSDGDPLYEVQVRYRYEVDGMIHEGNRLAFGYHASSGRPSHLEIYDRLKATPTVLVRYHPARPALSCLSFGIHRSIVLLFGFALIWLMITLLAHGAFWLSTQPDSILLNNLATPPFAQPPSR